MNDDTDIRAVLERGAGPLTPVDPSEVRARAGRRRLRRQGAWALGIVAVIAAITAAMFVDGDEQPRELDTVTTGTVATTAPTKIAVTTATTEVRWPPSRDSLPPYSSTPLPPNFDDDDGLYEQLVRERSTGWTPAWPLDDGGVAFRPSGMMMGPGEITEVVDADLVLVGYLMYPGGFIDRETFEDPDFDWEAFLRANLEQPAEDEIVAQIEAAGGLQDPIRIPEARR